MNAPDPSAASAAAMRKQRPPARLMALGICVLFAAGLLLSAAVVLTHWGHTHAHGHMGLHETCALCAYVSAAQNLFKFLFAGFLGLPSLWGLFAATFVVIKAIGFHMDFRTLVFLKVRMND